MKLFSLSGRGRTVTDSGIFLLLISVILFSPLPLLLAQVGVGVELFPSGSSASRDKSPGRYPRGDAYLALVSEELDLPEEDLLRLLEFGFGRREILKLALIAQSAKEELDKVVRLRRERWELRRVAEKYGIDYLSLFRKSEELHRHFKERLVEERKQRKKTPSQSSQEADSQEK